MCDTFAVLHENRTFFGKNSDREYDEAQLLEFVPAREHGFGSELVMTHRAIAQVALTNAILISRPYWIWGAEIGANAHGLTIGNEAIFSRIPANSAPGIIGMDFVRLALERASTVDEAIFVITSLLERYGQSGNCSASEVVCYHNSYLLADPAGASVLETVNRDWVVRPIRAHDAVSNGITTQRNYTQSSQSIQNSSAGEVLDFRAAFGDPTHEESPNFRRQRALERIRAVGEPGVGGLFGILRDHAPGPALPGRAPARICAHAQGDSLGQTTGSWVAELTADRCIHWVTGVASPCTAVFKPILLAVGLPYHGSPPGRRPDESSLWWRHDLLRRRLIDSTPEIRVTFEQERDEIEASFVSKINDMSPTQGRGMLADAQGLVDWCWREAAQFEHRWTRRLL